jgi:hypothetical protein
MYAAQMITLALALFANTGLVLILSSANFYGSSKEWYVFPYIGNGQYSDYKNEWYLTVGKQIVLTMVINSFSP